jgi:uncharacterized membrane protein
MKRGRLEAFSDGVLAIVITIMVLEMKVPHGDGWADLGRLWAVFVSYVLSFLYLGIYWNNHHHLMHTVERIDGRIMWANMHLLFWLSLVPFATGWMGENHFTELPTAVYGFVLLCAAIAYTVLQLQIVRLHGPDSALARAVGHDRKGKASMLAYVVAIPLAMWMPWFSYALFAAVALLWLVPDRRISSELGA